MAPFVLTAAAVLVARETDARPRTYDTTPPKPRAVVYPPNGFAPLQVRFDGSGSTDDVGVTEYRWDFGDGETESGEIANHLYPGAGTFTVRLGVSDAAGHLRYTSSTVVVAAPEPDHAAPQPRAELSTDHGPAPLTVAFDARASTDDHGITAYRWSFDDGEQSHEPVVSHTFSIPGLYEVRLSVEDAAGHRSNLIRTVRVQPGTPSEPPRAALTASATIATAPATIELSGAGSTDDREVVRYEWNFGDGTTSTGRDAKHRYSHAGMFTVTLTVYDDGGQRDETRTRLDIEEPRVVADRVLFDDAYAEGTSETSWATVALQPTIVHSGHFAIAVVPGSDDAFRLSFAPNHLEAYDRVGFWINGDTPERISVRAMLSDGQHERLGPPVSLRDHLLAGAGGALDSVWRHGVVSLDALGVGEALVTGLVWQAPTDDRPPPFFLDDIALLPPDEALPVVSTCAAAPPIRGFVSRDDGMLVADGVPFRAVGANMYFLQQDLSQHLLTGELRPLARVRQALDAAVCAGVSVIRLMGFNDSPPESQDMTVIQSSPGVFREDGLRGLDLALAEARDHHLRVILTLTNNWSAFGGLPRYAEWAHVPVRDAVGTPEVREWVAGYSRMLSRRINTFTGLRYRDDPTILAVELVNELRCHDCRAGQDATAFQLALAHDVALSWPNHLIGDGGEGFDDDPSLYPGLEHSDVADGDEGTSFHTLAESPDIDLLSYHLYPDDWKLDSYEAEAYIDAHHEIARQSGKVAYMGEFGEQTTDWARAATYDRWLDRLFGGNGGALALVWQLTYGGRPDDDGFALIPGESSSALGCIARHAHALTASGLDGVSLAVTRP